MATLADKLHSAAVAPGRSTGHLSTEPYRGVDRPGSYLTVDRFSDADSWQRFLGEHGDDYAELDSRCAQLTASEIEIR